MAHAHHATSSDVRQRGEPELVQNVVFTYAVYTETRVLLSLFVCVGCISNHTLPTSNICNVTKHQRIKSERHPTQRRALVSSGFEYCCRIGLGIIGNVARMIREKIRQQNKRYRNLTTEFEGVMVETNMHRVVHSGRDVAQHVMCGGA